MIIALVSSNNMNTQAAADELFQPQGTATTVESTTSLGRLSQRKARWTLQSVYCVHTVEANPGGVDPLRKYSPIETESVADWKPKLNTLAQPWQQETRDASSARPRGASEGIRGGLNLQGAPSGAHGMPTSCRPPAMS